MMFMNAVCIVWLQLTVQYVLYEIFKSSLFLFLGIIIHLIGNCLGHLVDATILIILAVD